MQDLEARVWYGDDATFGSIVQNGKFAASAPAFVMALKSVLLPTFGNRQYQLLSYSK